ncbi:MAG: PadR family transcriptional regulator, partial [Acidimicrobiia bacterium]|nr:PadR family transcriptional regulator [Acidimicrobiia bacterium]
MADRKLTTVHHVILGCLASFGPQTSYDLKRSSQRITGWMWAFPHTQLYTEPLKLVDAGLVEVDVEEGGRRRRTYSITPAGLDELARWSGELPDKEPEIRDLAFLKLYFADRSAPARVAELARQQAAMHEARADWVKALLEE